MAPSPAGQLVEPEATPLEGHAQAMDACYWHERSGGQALVFTDNELTEPQSRVTVAVPIEVSFDNWTTAPLHARPPDLVKDKPTAVVQDKYGEKVRNAVWLLTTEGSTAPLHARPPEDMIAAEDNSRALDRGQQSSTRPRSSSTLSRSTVKHFADDNVQAHCRRQQSSTWPSPSSILPGATVKHMTVDNSQAHDRDRQVHCRGQQSSTWPVTTVKYAADDSSQAQGRDRQAHCRRQQSSSLPRSSCPLPKAAVKHIDQHRQAHCPGRMPTAEDSTALRHAKPREDASGKDVKKFVKLKHRLIPRKLKHKLKLKHTLKLSFGTEAPIGNEFAKPTTNRSGGSGHALLVRRLAQHDEGITRECRPKASSTLT